MNNFFWYYAILIYFPLDFYGNQLIKFFSPRNPYRAPCFSIVCAKTLPPTPISLMVNLKVKKIVLIVVYLIHNLIKLNSGDNIIKGRQLFRRLDPVVNHVSSLMNPLIFYRICKRLVGTRF